MSQKVAIVMGSGSDRPVMEKGSAMLDRFGVEHTVAVTRDGADVLTDGR